MKRPEHFQLEPWNLPAELTAFHALLGEPLGEPTKELAERVEILPFFKQHRNLAALIGGYHAPSIIADVLSTELEIFGDWACDLMIGDKRRGQFCFVEFEDATPDSIFRRGKKGVPDWSPRLEHGLSQISDWFYHLAGNVHTPQFRSFFTTDLAHYSGLLVLGRDAFLADDQMHRLRWRGQNTLVGGKQVSIITYDELLNALTSRADVYTPRISAPPHQSAENPEP